MENPNQSNEFESCQTSRAIDTTHSIQTTTITAVCDSSICANCNRKFIKMKNKIKRKLDGSENLREYLSKRFCRQIPESGYVCDSCYQYYNRSRPNESRAQTSSSQTSVSSEIAELEINNGTHVINIKSAIFDEHHCLVCGLLIRNRLPAKAALEAYISGKIFIKEGARCCEQHLIKDGEKIELNSDSLIKLQTEMVIHSSDKIIKLLDSLCNEVNKQRHHCLHQCESWSDTDCKSMTGLTKLQIETIKDKYIGLNNSKVRSVFTALAIYLTKLRSGISNKHLSVLFKIDIENIKKCITAVRKELSHKLVDHKLGLKNITRQMLKENMTTFTRELFTENNNNIATLWDGTYIYIQKSSNNRFQRKTWSVQKTRSLVKPFVACCPNGYILDIYGPYPANMNDSEIIKQVFTTDKYIDLFEKNDVFIVDRGFRDAKTFLERKGFKVRMPELKPKSQNQLTTDQANKSRFVTKIRYMVEIVNGKLKQFRSLDRVRQNSTLNSLEADFKIAASLINEFFKPPNTDSDETFIAQLMKSRLNKENTLQKLVEEMNLNRKTAEFQKISTNQLDDFPKLEMCDLKYITLGSYQLKQALGYYAEMIGKQGDFIIEKHKNINGLIRSKLQSRHCNRETYQTYIQYEPNSDGRESIIGYTCGCKNGLRTVGMCSHVATIIWYLGYAKVHGAINQTAEHLNEIFPDTVVDGSDSEEE